MFGHAGKGYALSRKLPTASIIALVDRVRRR
jgi:hypothetical protein